MQTPQVLFWIIIGFIVFEFLLGKLLDYLDAKSWDSPLPDVVKGLYDDEKYEKAKRYDQEKSKIGLISGLISFVLILVMLFFDGFAKLDTWGRTLTDNYIFTTLIFFAVLGLASYIIGLPFSLYNTFVIEEKYGFNKMTKKTFITDTIKSLLLAVLVGGGLLALITFLFHKMGNNFWWIAWLVVVVFSIFMNMFYTTIFCPHFQQINTTRRR